MRSAIADADSGRGSAAPRRSGLDGSRTGQRTSSQRPGSTCRREYTDPPASSCRASACVPSSFMHVSLWTPHHGGKRRSHESTACTPHAWLRQRSRGASAEPSADALSLRPASEHHEVRLAIAPAIPHEEPRARRSAGSPRPNQMLGRSTRAASARTGAGSEDREAASSRRDEPERTAHAPSRDRTRSSHSSRLRRDESAWRVGASPSQAGGAEALHDGARLDVSARLVCRTRRRTDCSTTHTIDSTPWSSAILSSDALKMPHRWAALAHGRTGASAILDWRPSAHAPGPDRLSCSCGTEVRTRSVDRSCGNGA